MRIAGDCVVARAFRCAPVLAIAAFVAAAPAARASSSLGTSGAQASIDFKIVIPVVLRVKAAAEPREVSITDADVARGYVDVERGASLVVTSNSRAGFYVSIAFDSRLLARVVARLHGQAVEADAPGSSLHVDAARLVETPVNVGYRMYLAPGARPGTYRWPIGLAFAPGP